MTARLSIFLTLTEGATAPLKLVVEHFTPDELTIELSKFEAGRKDGLAIVPAVMSCCPSSCRNHGLRRVDCGGGKLHRLAANVLAVTLFGVDLDGWTQSRLDAYLAELKTRGFFFWAYSTYGFDPPLLAKARVFFLLSEPVTIGTAERWRDQLWPALLKHVGLGELEREVDSHCRDAAHFYYFGRKSSENAPTFFCVHDAGAPINVLRVLGDILRRPITKPPLPPVPAALTADEPNPVIDMNALRVRLRRYHPQGAGAEEKKDLVRRILAEEPLANEGARDASVHQAAFILASILPANTPKEAALELMRTSVVRMPGAPPTTFSSWMEKASDSFDRGRATRPQFEAQRVADQEALRLKISARLRRRREASLDHDRSIPPDEARR